jgi:hypothetical protein
MSLQSVRQAARRSALDAQAARRKGRANRERQLDDLALAVLTALGERDALIRAGRALQTMTEDEGLSVREDESELSSHPMIAARAAVRQRQDHR